MPDDTPEQARLKRMTAATSEPVLSDAEIDDLLADHLKMDAAGLSPGEDDYTPTYNFRAAARAGWKLKAGKASELVSVDLDDDRSSANQIFGHCMRMANSYSSTASVSTGQT